MSRSIVEYFTENGGYKCGYCNQENTRFSNGMWGHTLTPQDYQVFEKIAAKRSFIPPPLLISDNARVK